MYRISSLAIWRSLILTASVMALCYLWFAIAPGSPPPEAYTYFSAQQIEQGRAYSQALRLSYIADFVLQSTLLVWLIFSRHAAVLTALITKTVPGRDTVAALLYFIIIWLLLQCISLPFNYFSSFIWQQQWGFSTQTTVSWFIDYCKSGGIELFLTAAGAALLFYAFKRLPNLWWLAAAVLLSLWIVVASYLWPVVMSPLFNQFTPAADPAITDMVKRLADKAGLPVNEVLIMDASRRTNKANAYFAGVGNTRRVVLYDTLVRDYQPEEVEAVIAHELAHWRQGHIVKGMAWGIAGSFLGWALLYRMLRATLPSVAVLQVWPYILLFFYLISFIAAPITNAISRQMEREADAVAVALTNNPQAAVRLQISLAVKNCSDVAPAAYLRLFSTHPPALERIAAVSSPKP